VVGLAEVELERVEKGIERGQEAESGREEGTPGSVFKSEGAVGVGESPVGKRKKTTEEACQQARLSCPLSGLEGKTDLSLGGRPGISKSRRRG
jgi:hypothetical protein